MNAKDLREKNDDELNELIQERRDELMHFRLQMATGAVDNVRASREARREIARVKTILNERKRAAATADAGEKN
ncbi:MAG TPA: 50S ribosomal protein L29 [Candidatus Hydrogenedentes bacterium]|nr:50S ribosomal protein L29 [Candidatus Hydrogenedentota bacterium]